MKSDIIVLKGQNPRSSYAQAHSPLWLKKGAYCSIVCCHGDGVFDCVLLPSLFPWCRCISATGHAHLSTGGKDRAVKANVTALALGITIAIVAILMAALLAAFCVRRKVSLSRGGHRTLATSFENPVYEYEHSLK